MNKNSTSQFNYIDLVSEIKEARKKTAKFYRTDLHVHSILSHDWPSIHDKTGFIKKISQKEKGLKQKPDIFTSNFIKEAENKNLSMIAITDHNESDLAVEISQIPDTGITILPGIEIHVQTSLFPDSEIHILGIFPNGTTTKEIDKVFPPKCGMPESGKREGESTKQNLEKVINTIKQLGGICIAAHVSSTSGLRTMVHSQHVPWLQKNYLRRYLKEKQEIQGLDDYGNDLLESLQSELKPLDDGVQNTYLEFLAQHNFDAIQIQESEHRRYYEGEHVEALNIAPFPCIVASDAHTISDIGCTGHGTYIKMTEISLSGLRKALIDPGTRIRFDDTVPLEKPKRIKGITFEGGSFNGEIIGFSDNLSVLIGSRGTGKSALIEAIRFILCQPLDELPDNLLKPIKDRLKFTLRDTEVKVLFEDENGDLFVLKRRINENTTQCYSADGQAVPEIELPNSYRIQAEIYGWSEIEELSDSSRKQLKLLDRTIMAVEDLKSKVNQSLESLAMNRGEMVSLAREIHTFLPQSQGGSEVRKGLEDLETPELNKAFSKYDQSVAGQSSIESLGNKVNEITDLLLDEGEEIKISELLTKDLDSEIDNLEMYPWFDDFSSDFRKRVGNIQKQYSQLIKEVGGLVRVIEVKRTILEDDHVIIEEKLNQVAEESGQTDFKSALSRRKGLADRLKIISDAEKEIHDRQEKIEQLFEIRHAKIIPSLEDARRKLYEARYEKASMIARKLSEIKAAEGITMVVEHLGDKNGFTKSLGFKDERERTSGLFRKIDKQYINKDYPGYFTEKFSINQFINILLEDISKCERLKINYIRDNKTKEIVRLVSEGISTVNGEIFEMDEEGEILGQWKPRQFEYIEMDEPHKIWEHLSPWYYDGEVQPYYDPEKLDNLLKLENSDIDDCIKILLDGRQIDGLSPGERCSALIPIILVEGSTPLLIDQPEDNLDNKRVFDLVVDILRGLKEHRQIILATHNPNIPVSGDAEQVIVFDSPDKRSCIVSEQGSIDNVEIVKQIKSVMEGGDKAFEIRMRKYSLMSELH